MGLTTLGWYDNLDEGAAWSAIAALADQSQTVAVNAIVCPSNNKLVLAAAGIASATVENAGRVVAPSIRDVCLPYIDPVNLVAAAAVTPNDPHRIWDRRFNPLTLDPGEDMGAELLGDPGGAQDQWLLIWLNDAPITEVPSGAEIQSLRFHAAATLAPTVWDNHAIIFDEALQLGSYQVVGMRAESAGLVAARLVFKSSGNRPGCLGDLTPQEYGHDVWRAGHLGVWGEFKSNEQPTVDFLSISADTAEYGILDLIRTA